MKKIIGIILFVIAVIFIVNMFKNKSSDIIEPLPRNDLQDENIYINPEDINSMNDFQNYE